MKNLTPPTELQGLIAISFVYPSTKLVISVQMSSCYEMWRPGWARLKCAAWELPPRGTSSAPHALRVQPLSSVKK
eukprot:4863332-Amphidinium_carterae.1